MNWDRDDKVVSIAQQHAPVQRYAFIYRFHFY